MKIGIQSGCTVNEIGAKDAYKAFAEAGFEAIDWNINDRLSTALIKKGDYKENNIYEKDIDEILQFLDEELCEIRKNGLEISQAHAPFPAYLTDSPELLDYMIEVYKKNIILCQAVGCKNLIIHGISLAKKDSKNTPQSIKLLNDKLYTSLIETLCQTDVTVCIENLASGICSNPYEAVDMIDRYNTLAGKECFGLCLDIGHLNLLHIDTRNYIPILGKRIKALHVHDNDGITDQHKAPYTGTINWKYFCEELRKVGYSGDISFETFNQTTLKVIDRDMLAPWLKLIYEAGIHFKKEIMDVCSPT